MTTGADDPAAELADALVRAGILNTPGGDIYFESELAAFIRTFLARWRLVPIERTSLDQERDRWASALFGVDIETERRKRHLTPGAHTKPQPALHDAYTEAVRVLRASAASPETIHRILTQIQEEQG